MKETIIYCDICRAPGALTCYFTVDRRLDPAGSSDDVQESMDLCCKHQWEAFLRATHPQGMRGKTDYITTKRVFSEFMDMVKFRDAVSKASG